MCLGISAFQYWQKLKYCTSPKETLNHLSHCIFLIRVILYFSAWKHLIFWCGCFKIKTYKLGISIVEKSWKVVSYYQNSFTFAELPLVLSGMGSNRSRAWPIFVNTNIWRKLIPVSSQHIAWCHHRPIRKLETMLIFLSKLLFVSSPLGAGVRRFTGQKKIQPYRVCLVPHFQLWLMLLRLFMLGERGVWILRQVLNYLACAYLTFFLNRIKTLHMNSPLCTKA